jgi:hypothetical protein
MVENLKFRKDQILLSTEVKFYSDVNDEGKRQSHVTRDKISILVQVDIHIGTCTELVLWLGFSLSLLSTAVNYPEESVTSYVQC